MLTVLLPKAIINNLGVSLMDFFRQIILAHRMIREENLYFRLYPLVTNLGDTPEMMKDSTEVARYTEHRLARFALHPKEKQLMKVYQRLRWDFDRASFPSAFRMQTFHHMYIRGIDFDLLQQALDAILWISIQRTTRTIDAETAIRFFRSIWSRAGTTDLQIEGERFRFGEDRKSIDHTSGAFTYEKIVDLKFLPFQTDVQYIIVYKDNVPISGRNTICVDFFSNPARVRIRVNLPSSEARTVELSSSERAELEEYMYKVIEEIFCKGMIANATDVIAARVNEKA